jgi:hypothetical protein
MHFSPEYLHKQWLKFGCWSNNARTRSSMVTRGKRIQIEIA